MSETKTVPSSLEVFAQDVRSMVEEIGESFTKPDDDWLSTLIIETASGERIAMGLAGDLFDGEERKDQLVSMLQQLIIAFKVRRFGFVISAWGISFPKETGEEDAMAVASEWRGHFQDHPERTEQVIVQVVDQDGEISWSSELERHEDAPPTLTEWKKIDTLSGRFAGLREALRGETS